MVDNEQTDRVGGPAPPASDATELVAGSRADTRRLADRIVAQGLASADDVDACLALFREKGQATTAELGTLLVARGLVSAAELAALEADEAPGGLRPGMRLGRYRLEAEVARGGMGVVYAAHDTELARRVAIKVIKRDAATAEEIRRLQREAQAAARVAHPGVIAIHAVGAEPGPDGRPLQYIAMDFVDGPTLAGVLPELDVAARVRLLAGVAEAVGAAHAEGVVHRDLKPANVLLADGGQRPVVTDFGLARVEDAVTALTRTGQVMGTPPYMAPEQVLAQADRFGPPTDVWALGVMLFEALTGRLPFDGDSTQRVFEAILDPSELRTPAVPRPQVDLRTICLKALAPDPARRYPDGTALAAELRRWLAHEPILARPAGRLARGWRRLRRRPWRALAVVLTAALLSVGAAMGWQRRSQGEAFARHRAAALVDASRGDWGAAQVRCERALALREDAELQALAARCARHISHAARVERLQKLLPPYRRMVERIEPYFYIADADIVPRLTRLRAGLAELERRLAEERLEDLAEGWVLLGVGWYHAGDLPRADRALARAIALDPADGLARLTLGRLCLRRGSQPALSYHGHHVISSDRARRRWLQRAREHLDAASSRWEGAREIDRATLAACQAVLTRRGRAGLVSLCRQLLTRFGRRPGTELFLILQTLDAPPRVARPLLDEALARCPHSVWARVTRAETRRLDGDAAGALADLDRALALAPRDVPGLQMRALLHGSQGRLAAGLADIERALAVERSSRIRLVRTMFLQDLGQLETARAELEALTREAPDEPGLWIYAGMVYRRVQNWSGAIAALDEAIRRTPEDAMAWLQRGICHDRAGDPVRADADLSRAIRLQPDNAETHYNRAALRADARPEAAAVDLDAALARDPRHAHAFRLRARLRRQRGRLTDALSDARRAHALAPSEDAMQTELSLAIDALGSRAAAHSSGARHPAAQADYDRIVGALEAVRPLFEEGLVVHLNNRALVRFALGRTAGGRADLERALQLAAAAGTTSASLRVTVACVLRNRARFGPPGPSPEALADLTRAVDSLSAVDHGPGTRARAVLLLILRERAGRHRASEAWAQALADHDRVLALAPDDLPSRHERGTLRLWTEDLVGAEADFREVVRRQPTLWPTWAMLGQVLAARGQTAEALRALRKALPHLPPGMRDKVQALIDQLTARR